ncbi:TIGR03643 family protein [uncultured Fibrella sp.]|uniref:TIGR03643 family protein n=1 Tax=uncultured Fibrella sp. TaxID=1284596 RepID=UPI0035CB8354
MNTNQPILTQIDLDRVVEMAWEDRTPFDAITTQFGLSEQQVIEVMRQEMKASSFRMWRARVQGRKTKHTAKSPLFDEESDPRFRSKSQRIITGNKLSKR